MNVSATGTIFQKRGNTRTSSFSLYRMSIRKDWRETISYLKIYVLQSWTSFSMITILINLLRCKLLIRMTTLWEISLRSLLKKSRPILKSARTPENVFFVYNVVTYFVEKFPKRIYDFFDLLISRIKGFYNEEIIRLKA